MSFCVLSVWRVSLFVLDEFVILRLSVASEENKSSHQIWTAEFEEDQGTRVLSAFFGVCRLW